MTIDSTQKKQDVITVRLVIGGKVQGVFFRSSLKSVADVLSVHGWTKNLYDGTVEALLQGPEVQVCKVIEWCHVGPRNSRVDFVNQQLVDNSLEIYRNFVILT